MKRIITILLALVMVVSVCAFAVACQSGTDETKATTTTAATTSSNTGKETTSGDSGKETTTNNSTSETTASEIVTETTTTEDTGSLENWTGKTKLPGYLDVDFGGKTFLFAAWVGEPTGRWNNPAEIWVEAMTNDAINNAVYERNTAMKSLYNCTIAVDDGGWENGFNQDVAAGSGKYISACREGVPASDSYYNVLNLDIDFTQSWWDQAFYGNLSCEGKVYALSGDFSLHTMSATWIIFYNKDVYDNHFSDVDIYQLVRDHKWTVDKMVEMCQKVLNDGDGDQEYKFSEGANADTLGCMSTTHFARGLFWGAGERYVDKDDNGNMICALQNGKGSDVIDKIRTLMTDESYLTEGYTNVQKAMQNGTTLFAGEVMDVLARMVEADGLRVGVLPQPLYDENQTEYYHYVNNRAPFYYIPTSYANMEEIADFFTLFAAHSQKLVRSVYVNSYKYTYASDEGSAEMVDIILNSRIYDPGYQLGLANNFDSALPSMCSPTGKNQFAAAAGRFSSAINEAIRAYKEKVTAIDDPV